MNCDPYHPIVRVFVGNRWENSPNLMVDHQFLILKMAPKSQRPPGWNPPSWRCPKDPLPWWPWGNKAKHQNRQVRPFYKCFLCFWLCFITYINFTVNRYIWFGLNYNHIESLDPNWTAIFGRQAQTRTLTETQALEACKIHQNSWNLVKQRFLTKLNICLTDVWPVLDHIWSSMMLPVVPHKAVAEVSE